MNFGPNHYVAVLQLRRAERDALALLENDLVGSVTPLIEVSKIGIKTVKDSKNPKGRKEPKSLAEHLKTCFDAKAVSSLGRFGRCLLDLHHIQSGDEESARAVFDLASRLKITFTPVTGLSRKGDVVPALERSQNGIALRLVPADFERCVVRRVLPTFIATHNLDPAQVDLVIDLCWVDKMVVAGVLNKAEAFLRDVPYPQSWRTLSLIGCAVPLSMGFIDRDGYGTADRTEFRAWRDHLYRDRGVLPRLPTFGDHGVRHLGGGDDEIDFSKGIWFSPTIRYARSDQWLIVKGHSTEHEHASKQIPRLSRILVRGKLKDHFDGKNHCPGCEGAIWSASSATGYRTPEAWVRLGTVHHITNTVRQIQSLAWP